MIAVERRVLTAEAFTTSEAIAQVTLGALSCLAVRRLALSARILALVDVAAVAFTIELSESRLALRAHVDVTNALETVLVRALDAHAETQ